MSTAVWQSSDTELLTGLAVLETRLHATWAEMLSVIAEVDSRGTAEAVGYRSTVDLVRAVGRVWRGEARARVAAAAEVLPGREVGGAPLEPRHRLVHHSDWRIEMAGGIPEFHSPPWLGGPARRNPLNAVPGFIPIRE
jgi:hypothetical protein